MSFPRHVQFQLDTYTRACNCLLERLSRLQIATSGGTSVHYDYCIEVFNSVLSRFLQRSRPVDRNGAALQFTNLLTAEADLFRPMNAAAAELFSEIGERVRDGADSWRHEDDVEQLHRDGERLGRLFFHGSQWEETSRRLACKCRLKIEYDMADRGDRLSQLAEPFGYKPAPVSYYRTFQCADTGTTTQDVVVVRITPAADFWLYVAYPFLFLHEYTAHVYSTGTEERFNDGWMLHAAATFLKRAWMNESGCEFLHREQVDIFYDRLYSVIGRIPRDACRFARELDDWISVSDPSVFPRLTHELAAFVPATRAERTWHTRFVNTVHREFYADRSRLREKILIAPGAVELLSAIDNR